ncbi:MAG TPA: sigma-70 family RNA polymerase sigma factor [Planctomycetota bacterium]|nr:sigma-70 family RNA polymerase sigma factor [Planctomycetota bacterium]
MGEDEFNLYLSTIPAISLSAREERQLARRSANGDESARKQLIALHLRLVAELATHYAGSGLTSLDLVEEGNVGLMKAAKRYSPKKGRRFADYATWWIRREIGRVLREPARKRKKSRI